MLNIDTLKENLSNIVNAKKLKEFSSSNTGFVTIAIALAVVLVGLHFIHKHSEESSENATLSSWSATDATSSASVSPTYSFAQAPDLKTSTKNAKTGNKGNAFIAPENQNLQTEITALKDEVSLLEKQLNQLTLSNLKKPYQLLGVRFDAPSKQWVVDIKYENTLYSLKAGETFEGWHVLSVDNEGAQIE